MMLSGNESYRKKCFLQDEGDMMSNSKGINRYVRLAIAFVTMLFAGIIYSWSILKSPFASEFGWTPSQLALNFTLTMCFFAVGGLISGFFSKRTGPKIFIFIGAVIAAVGFVLTSGNTGSIALLYLTYGVMGGLGIGLAYNPLVSSTNAWFQDRKGFSSGIMMMGFGASSLVIGNIAASFIEIPEIGWRKTYIILGVAIGVVLIAAGIFAKLPDSMNQNVKGNVKSSAGEVIKILKTPNFWMFYVYIIAISVTGNVVISAAKDIGLSTGMSAALATSLVGILSIFNAFGRLLSGTLFDKYGRKLTMTFASSACIIASALILLALINQSVVLGIAGLCIAGLSYGFSPTVSSAVCADFYGPELFPNIFSIISTMLIPTSLFATIVGTMVTVSGSYNGAMILVIVVSSISLGLSFAIRKPGISSYKQNNM